MEQLNEYKYRLIEEIDTTPNKCLPAGSLLVLDRKHKDSITKSLDYLEKENYLTKEEVKGFTFYSIKEQNKQFETIKVICPKCKSVRKIYSPQQILAMCKNKDCQTPTGQRTTFCIRKKVTTYDMSKILHIYKE